MQLDTTVDVFVTSKETDCSNDILRLCEKNNLQDLPRRLQSEEDIPKSLVIIVKNNSEPLFGPEWLDHIHSDLERKSQIFNVKTKKTQEFLIHIDSIYTEGTGTVKNARVILSLKPGAKSDFFCSETAFLYSESSSESEYQQARNRRVME